LAVLGSCSTEERAPPITNVMPSSPEDTPRTDPPPPSSSSSPSEPKPCIPPASSSDAALPEVLIAVKAAHGPHGASAPTKVDRRLYGTSIADWRPQDYMPKPDTTFKSYLAALRPGVLRWPAGHNSQEYVWPRAAGEQHGGRVIDAAHVDAFIALAKSVGAEPLLAINVKRSVPAIAADLVRYVNVEKGYGVRWFQIGNEPDLTDGVTESPTAYAKDLIAFVDAMRAVDPKIGIVAPELLTGAHVGGMHGRTDWMTPILTQAAGRIDGISWHYYPLDSGQSNPSSSAIVSFEHLFQETAADWAPAGLAFADEVMPALAKLRDAHAPKAEVWVTEFAEDPGPRAGQGVSETVGGALWSIDALGRYAEHAPGGVLRWIFETVSDHAYGLLDGWHMPRPSYGALWLHARHVGDRYVDTSSSQREKVAAHAALRADGALTVVVVNKSQANVRIHLDVQELCVTQGNTMTFTGEGWAASTFRIQGTVLTPESVWNGPAPTPLLAQELFDMTLPQTSIRVIAYRP